MNSSRCSCNLADISKIICIMVFQCCQVQWKVYTPNCHTGTQGSIPLDSTFFPFHRVFLNVLQFFKKIGRVIRVVFTYSLVQKLWCMDEPFYDVNLGLFTFSEICSIYHLDKKGQERSSNFSLLCAIINTPRFTS